MPWKEPGDKPREPRDREPWGQGGRGGGHGGGPDFDAWLRNLRRWLSPFGHGPWGVTVLIALAIVLWFLIGGWTMIGPHQVGVVLRFGQLEGVLQPGMHLRLPPPIDYITKVDLGQAHTLSDQTRFLTSDGQLARVDYYVQYKVQNARDYLFVARDAHNEARNAAEVVVRAEIGTRSLQELRHGTNAGLGKDIATRVQAILDRQHLGINVTEAGIQKIGVPPQVQKAYDGIGTARQAAKGAQAAAAADVVHDKAQAKAKAAAIKANAMAYHDKVIAEARADVARFDAILAQYKVAPQATKHRLWLDTMQDVLSKNRVVVNSGSANVIIQFPAQPAGRKSPVPAGSSAPPATASSVAPAASTATSDPALHGARR